jgi:hypothetical protein
MNRAGLLIITLSTFLGASNLQAQMYHWTDEKGVKHFSNVAPADSGKEINIGKEHSDGSTANEKRARTNNRKPQEVKKSTRKTREKAKPVPKNETPPESKKVEVNRTVFEKAGLNIGRFPISQDELISDEKKRLKQIESYSVSASLSREEMVKREQKRLEGAIQTLQRAPLSKFGSYNNKRKQVGYYQYRLTELLESPDTYFSTTGE